MDKNGTSNGEYLKIFRFVKNGTKLQFATVACVCLERATQDGKVELTNNTIQVADKKYILNRTM